MKSRRVEFTETVLVGEFRFEEGDRHTFTEDVSNRFIELGWAKDPETGEQGTRKPGGEPLRVDPIVSEGA